MGGGKDLTMCKDKKDNENVSKPVYRFDNDDWVIPSEDVIRKKNPKNYKRKNKDDKNKD